MKLRPHVVKPLAEQIMRAVRQHYLSSPGSPSQMLVFEALNALGFAAGTVLAGTGADKGAVEFFHKATADTMVNVAKQDRPDDEITESDIKETRQ